MTTLGRRAFLTVVGMLSPLGAVWGVAQSAATGAAVSAPIGVDDFLALSMRLTGRTGLDREIARIYLNALLSAPANVPLLSQLALDSASRTAGVNSRPSDPIASPPAQIALEAEIITVWYTGTYDVNGERHLGTHTGALMWSALGAPAPGICAGATWSRAPRPIVR